VTTLLWLRRDLRRADHPALRAAAESGDGRVVVAFVVDPALWRGAGDARRAWLAATLVATDEAYDGRLVLRQGDPVEVVPALAAEVGATSVHVTRETTPVGRRRDQRVSDALHSAGIGWVETGTPYAVGPGLVLNQQGAPYAVFTPFSKAWREHGWPQPAAAPEPLELVEAESDERALRLRDEALGAGRELPEAGEDAARRRWEAFLDGALTDYADDRDRPDRDGTTRLSPYLKLGVVHPRTLLHDLGSRRGKGAETLRTELAWREFYADVLWNEPSSAWHDLKPGLGRMAYDDEGSPEVTAWREGRTGFPIVDAGMRQLLAEGWMHNRVRMITASFLVKDLHVWWPVGARHFLEHLIDGDIASNNHGWQWVAGTGTDAAPYFRVFNPMTQGRKFDPNGDYVRHWVPELRHLEGVAVHEPWKHHDGYAEGYPKPIVDHGEERAEALRRYEAAR
jgi:deoxyribodipyrimidine photo-lyase